MSVSQKEKMFFAEHLSLLLRGGVSLNEALNILTIEAKSKAFKKALSDVLRQVLEGRTFHDSLKKYPQIFDNFFQNVIQIGEESGTLEENLKYLSLYIRSEYLLRKKVTGSLIYPLIIIVMALFIVITVSFFILPRLVGLFRALGITLPLATRILLATGGFLNKYGLLILIGAVVLFAIFRILNSIKIFRFYFHKISLYLPFFGIINKNRNLTVFSRTLYTLLKSGVPILDSLNVCIDTISNEVFKKDMSLVKSAVERGEKISQGLKRYPEVFPSIFSNMVLVGEKTGALEESLLHLVDFYDTEVDTALKNLTGIMEPLVLILVGLFVAFVALAIITPIYQFSSGLRTR